MGLLSGLESLGLKKASSLEIYEKEESVKKEANKPKEDDVPKSEINEETLIFDKTYKCPVCDSGFKSKKVKEGKVRTISQDSDLRPVYSGVDCVKYGALVCPRCGFAAITRYFKPLSPTQNKWIKEEISANFSGYKLPAGAYSYDDAIMMHKLALMSTIVKKGKTSERAYCCLMLAWLSRGKYQITDDEEEKKALEVDELEMIEKAYDGFVEAFSKEPFPMCGMDEMTLDYLCADLARRLKKYDDAERLASHVIISKNSTDRFKDKARNLRELIAEEKKHDLTNE